MHVIRRKRIIISCIAAITSMVMCYLWGSMKAGLVFGGLFLITGMLSSKTRQTLNGFNAIGVLVTFFFISSFVIVVVCQRVLNENVRSLGLLRLFLNAMISLAVIFFFLLLTAKGKMSIIFSSGLLTFLTTVNYYVYLFRGSELNPSDILSIGTAANVAAEYKVNINSPLLYAWLLLILFWFIILDLPGISFRRKIIARVISVFGIAICSLTIAICAQKIQVLHFMQTGSVGNGFLLNFVLQIKETVVQKPDNYDVSVIAGLEEDFFPAREESDEPDIIVIMNESFADLSVLGNDLNTNIEVTPFVSSLTENTIKGYALSSVFGGGTPNSEYEFLSGNSLLFLPPGAIVYQQHLKKPVYSMVSEMKSRGYRCLALHPYLSNGWERKQVYPLLGFDEAFFIDDFPQQKLMRSFVSDQELFEEIVDISEKCSPSDKLFMFCVSMQNHGGYFYEGNDFQNTVFLEGYNNAYPDAEQYLSLIHATDSAVEWLIETLSMRDRKTVVVFFGDHLPKLDDRFYQELHGKNYDTLDEQMLKYTVPFFIWSNYDIDEEDTGLISLNYLSLYMYKAARMGLPPYEQFLAEIKKTVPCMNAYGYYSLNNNMFYQLNDAEGEEKEQLNIYHQFVYNSLFDSANTNGFFFPH